MTNAMTNDMPNDPDWSDLGSAKRGDRREPERSRPSNASDAEVEAVGKLSEAMEKMEVARGHLYAFHQLSGAVDLSLQDAVAALRDCGHAPLADAIDRALVGRDVIAGSWTYQLVEEYDDGYVRVFREVERRVRADIMDGVRHVFEAEMQSAEQAPAASGGA
jgi:hypothetical protein